MNQFIGTKVIQAIVMNRREYTEYRGWELPKDENGADEGYLVEYLDGGKPNHGKHKGYISWSPKEQFEHAYRPIDADQVQLQALRASALSHAVATSGHNGHSVVLTAAKAYQDFLMGVTQKAAE